MIAIYFKEISSFFSSIVGYLVIGIFVTLIGLLLWVFPSSSILESPYASLDGFFDIAPMVFLFLIPAVTMRSISEEIQLGTIEVLKTKPLSTWGIIIGKYLAYITLIFIALLPLFIYYQSIYELGSPKGNIDFGAFIGSYFGLLLLASSFTSIGMAASSFTSNQIVSFVFAIFMSFMFYYIFYMIAEMEMFYGQIGSFLQQFGIDYHYTSMSRGVIDTRDVLYFISINFIFLSIVKFNFDKAN